MPDQVKIPLKNLALDQATPDQLRYWLKLLGIRPEVSGRIAYLNPDQADQVKRMASAISSGTSPRDAATQIGSMAMMVPTAADPSRTEKALVSLIEEVRRLRDDNAGRMTSMERQIAFLTMENKALRDVVEHEAATTRALMAPPTDPPQKIIPWTPEARPDPAATLPWWRVTWLSLVAPERLRRNLNN